MLHKFAGEVERWPTDGTRSPISFLLTFSSGDVIGLVYVPLLPRDVDDYDDLWLDGWPITEAEAAVDIAMRWARNKL